MLSTHQMDVGVTIVTRSPVVTAAGILKFRHTHYDKLTCDEVFQDKASLQADKLEASKSTF